MIKELLEECMTIINKECMDSSCKSCNFSNNQICVKVGKELNKIIQRQNKK